MKKFFKKNDRGFTLAELLIVVAIIAVLVAVSIPIFTNQLENSREATDAANLRAAYAEVMACALTGQEDVANGVTVTMDGTDTTKIASVQKTGVKVTQQQKDWQNTSITDIGGIAIANVPASDLTKTWTVTWTASTNKVTFTQA